MRGVRGVGGVGLLGLPTFPLLDCCALRAPIKRRNEQNRRGYGAWCLVIASLERTSITCCSSSTVAVRLLCRGGQGDTNVTSMAPWCTPPGVRVGVHHSWVIDEAPLTPRQPPRGPVRQPQEVGNTAARERRCWRDGRQGSSKISSATTSAPPWCEVKTVRGEGSAR